MSTNMFSAYLNFRNKFNLKKLLETVEEYSAAVSQEAEDLLMRVREGVATDKAALLDTSSSSIVVEGSQSAHDLKDVLSIFFSPEVIELGKKQAKTDSMMLDLSPSQVSDRVGAELEAAPSPVYRLSLNSLRPPLDETTDPGAEVEFLSTYKFRGPLCTYLDKNEMPEDLHTASVWLGQYLTTVAGILLGKVKEIETGLSVAALKDREVVEAKSVPSAVIKRVKTKPDEDSSKLLSKYFSSQKSHVDSKVENARDSIISGFGRHEVGEEEKVSDEESPLVAGADVTRSLLERDDVPFCSLDDESPQELECFGDLLRQLELPLSKIKLKTEVTPQYITKKTAHIIRQSNILQLENTAMELFLHKQRVTINYNVLDLEDRLKQNWGQQLNELLGLPPAGKPAIASPTVADVIRDTTNTSDSSSDTKFEASLSHSSSTVVDTDTVESVSVSVPELSRFLYTPPKEIIAFDALGADHRYDVEPPTYRFMPIEEAVRRADQKRDLSKRLNQMKREILRTYAKEPESSDEDSDEGEESGWGKWFPYLRREALVNEAIDSLIALNASLHKNVLKTLAELEARKQTILIETREKANYSHSLLALESIKHIPPAKRLPSQRKFPDVLFKTMKSFLADDLKTKNLMLAHQRTLQVQISDLGKTVKRLDSLQKKADWGDLALQRLHYNGAHRRNSTIDDDVAQLKKLGASYTLQLIHSREELDVLIRENRALAKKRDLSVKKKNTHQELYVAQYKKLINVQEMLRQAPKMSDVERFVMHAKTEGYKKKKMKQYMTELEVKAARKQMSYLKSRLDGLRAEPKAAARLRQHQKKLERSQWLAGALEKLCREADTSRFSVHVKSLGGRPEN